MANLPYPDRFTPTRDEFRFPTAAPEDTEFRHSGWEHRRAQVWAALCQSGATNSQLDLDDGSLVAEANHCHCRWCQPCAAARAGTIARNVANFAEEKKLRFYTLTLKHNEASARDQVKRLMHCFALLRRAKSWKAAVTGGVAFLELKVGKGGGWHPHLHILAEGTWFAQKDLSALWYGITGDSFIVDVRAAGDRGNVVAYVAGYATKPFDPSVFNQEGKLIEAMQALKGTRMANTFGSWRGLKLEEHDEPSHNLRPLGAWADLVRDAACGDEDAMQKIIFIERCLADRRRGHLEHDPP
jgi:hypothetical protein